MKIPVNYRIQKDLVERLKQVANDIGVTQNEIVESLLAEHLDEKAAELAAKRFAALSRLKKPKKGTRP
ncbi:MAG TPA: hypothetical protein VFB72_16140 [Verrucomicrobiae bacterium]|nr:hypothetical protein [Verrucomicrobiae bacterium]